MINNNKNLDSVRQFLYQNQILDVGNLAKIIVLGPGDFDPTKSDLLLLTKDYALLAFGPNLQGLLGLGYGKSAQTQAIEVPRLCEFKIVDIACGGEHLVALTKCGLLFTWGDNRYGKLGLGSIEKKKVFLPKLVMKSSNCCFTSIKCGRKHSLALTKSGKVFQWGFCGFKKLTTPTIVSKFEKKKVTKIFCGKWHSIALTEDGCAFVWGGNEQGQLGIGPHFKSKSRPFWVKIPGDVPIKSIFAGEFFSLFWTVFGLVYACGSSHHDYYDDNDRLFYLRLIGVDNFFNNNYNHRILQTETLLSNIELPNDYEDSSEILKLFFKSENETKVSSKSLQSNSGQLNECEDSSEILQPFFKSNDEAIASSEPLQSNSGQLNECEDLPKILQPFFKSNDETIVSSEPLQSNSGQLNECEDLPKILQPFFKSNDETIVSSESLHSNSGQLNECEDLPEILQPFFKSNDETIVPSEPLQSNSGQLNECEDLPKILKPFFESSDENIVSSESLQSNSGQLNECEDLPKILKPFFESNDENIVSSEPLQSNSGQLNECEDLPEIFPPISVSENETIVSSEPLQSNSGQLNDYDDLSETLESFFESNDENIVSSEPLQTNSEQLNDYDDLSETLESFFESQNEINVSSKSLQSITGTQNESAKKVQLKFFQFQPATLRLALLSSLKYKLKVTKLAIKTTFKNCSLTVEDGYDLNLSIFIKLLEKQYNKSKTKTSPKPATMDDSDDFVYKHNYINEILSLENFVQDNMNQFLYHHKFNTISLLVYFDEMLVIGNPQPVIDLLKKNSVPYDECGEISGDKTQKFLNFSIKKSDNKFWLNQQDLIEFLDKKYPIQLRLFRTDENVVKYPMDCFELEASLPDSNDANSIRIYELKYFGNGTRPDLHSSIDYLLSNQTNTSQDIRKKIDRILQYSVDHKTDRFCLGNFTDSSLNVFVDCIICNNEIKLGVLVQWLGSTIWWKSKKVEKSLGSLDDLKLYATIEGVAEGYKVAQMIGHFCDQFAFPENVENTKNDTQFPTDLYSFDYRDLSQNPPDPPKQSNLPKFTVICNHQENFALYDIVANKIVSSNDLHFIRWFDSMKYFKSDNVSKPNLATTLLVPINNEELVEVCRDRIMNVN